MIVLCMFSLLNFVLVPVLCHRDLSVRALQKSHEKSQLEKWENKFIPKNENVYQTLSLVMLLGKIVSEQLSGCTSIILYDIFTEYSSDLLLGELFKTIPLPYIHGQIKEFYKVKYPALLASQGTCVNYILFLKDVMQATTIIGRQSTNKVVLVARSSQWRVYEFLANEESQKFMNLLVIAKSQSVATNKKERPYILYTHKLYVDALGSSIHQIITSWKNGSFSRPLVDLFPKKIARGFAGHRFIVSLAHQPPFVIKGIPDDNNDVQWDGIEVRLVNLLSKMFNFTTDYREAVNWEHLGPANAVVEVVAKGKANLGISGLYVTDTVMSVADVSQLHHQDCAAFLTLTSTALPRYRAIMGPFHWSVWLALTFVYLLAIFPLAFSDQHTLRHLVSRPEEVENMFWYVYGTFTNAFSFMGKQSWSKSDKVTTRLLIGFYWLFTIIITACYTGSIIAFVTLPIFPETIDTPQELLSHRYEIGTLDKGGWQFWFQNSSDPITNKILKKVDLVADVESGLKNMSKAFFWPYAFMGSRAHLDYIVRTNFTTMNKRSLLHISSECFVPFSVSLIYNKNSLYSGIINGGVLKAVESGIMLKLRKDVEWFNMRSATGKLLAANSFGSSLKTLTVEDRALTLVDTQGMFLLLGIGFVLGGASLVSEWMGGCFRLCKSKLDKNLVGTEDQAADSTPQPTISHEEDNCIFHKADDADAEVEDHIDKLFNFENVFGDSFQNAAPSNTEEIIEEYKIEYKH